MLKVPGDEEATSLVCVCLCVCLRRSWAVLATAVIRSSETGGGKDDRGGAAAFHRPQSASKTAFANSKLLANIFSGFFKSPVLQDDNHTPAAARCEARC